MSQPADPAAAAALFSSIVTLGHDLFAMKLYNLAICVLYFYDYFLTLDDEIRSMWQGRKTPVFWLFILNRYLTLSFATISVFSYFSKAWTPEICQHYGFMLTLETVILICVAEILLTLRVYALTKKNKLVPVVSGLIIIGQWIIAIYTMSQSSKGTTQVAALLSKRDFIPSLPALPETDAYDICIFVGILTSVPWVETFLCLCLAFDGLVFLTLTCITIKAATTYKLVPLMRLIQRDGIMYFFALFTSNLVWLLLLLHGRPVLKFIQNEPAMRITAIMMNRITLNLKTFESHGQGSTPSSGIAFHAPRPNDTYGSARPLRPVDYEMNAFQDHKKQSNERSSKQISSFY